MITSATYLNPGHTLMSYLMDTGQRGTAYIAADNYVAQLIRDWLNAGNTGGSWTSGAQGPLLP